MKKERTSNFELLRIIAMLLIISFHLVYKSSYVVSTLNLNNVVIKIFWLVGEIGVNLFLLISGYFMVKSKFSIKKIFILIFELVFYNSISAVLAQILGVESITRILYSPYWFVRMYIMLCFLSPFINRLIEHINKKEYQKLIGISIIIWSILPTILGVMKNSTENLDFYSRMIWFVIMYFIGGYVRLYDIKFLTKKRNSIALSIISFFLLCSSIIVIFYLKKLVPRLANLEIAYLWGPNNIITLIFSVSFFELFSHIDIGSKKIINTISSTTLGIYMIHDGLLRKFIWQNIFHTKEMLASNYAIPYIISVTIVIFVVGFIIDLIRQFIEKKTIRKIIYSTKFDNFICNICKKANKIVEQLI